MTPKLLLEGDVSSAVDDVVTSLFLLLDKEIEPGNKLMIGKVMGTMYTYIHSYIDATNCMYDVDFLTLWLFVSLFTRTVDESGPQKHV